MLTVRNLPPEPTWRDWVREEAPFLKSLALGGIALICLASLIRPAPNMNWYRLSNVDGVLVVSPAISEQLCREGLNDDLEACIRGEAPLGAAEAFLSP